MDKYDYMKQGRNIRGLDDKLYLQAQVAAKLAHQTIGAWLNDAMKGLLEQQTMSHIDKNRAADADIVVRLTGSEKVEVVKNRDATFIIDRAILHQGYVYLARKGRKK